DDVSDHADAARDAATGLLRPACRSRARVERVDVAVVGADEHCRAQSRHVGDRSGGIDVASGRLRPGELPRLGSERVDLAVGVACEDPAKTYCRSPVEAPRSEAELASGRARGPALPAGP